VRVCLRGWLNLTSWAPSFFLIAFASYVEEQTHFVESFEEWMKVMIMILVLFALTLKYDVLVTLQTRVEIWK
jgi:hypothetical protein